MRAARRSSGGILALLLIGGCAGAPGTRPAPLDDPRTTAAPALATSPLAGSPLAGSLGTIPGPSLTLVNDYPIAQHVFLDGEPLGEIAAGGRATFTVPAGTHAVVCTDSQRVDDHASRIEATFDPGYGYTFRLSGH